MNDLPDSYRVQHGCADCATCYNALGVLHYCDHRQDRPLRWNDPGFPDPMNPPYDVDGYMAAATLWEVWAWTHACDPRGICAHWTRKEDGDHD